MHEVPITILYDGDTSTRHPVTHGASVMLSTMKFISIEHPLKFYGILGILFLGIVLKKYTIGIAISYVVSTIIQSLFLFIANKRIKYNISN